MQLVLAKSVRFERAEDNDTVLGTVALTAMYEIAWHLETRLAAPHNLPLNRMPQKLESCHRLDHIRLVAERGLKILDIAV